MQLFLLQDLLRECKLILLPQSHCQQWGKDRCFFLIGLVPCHPTLCDVCLFLYLLLGLFHILLLGELNINLKLNFAFIITKAGNRLVESTRIAMKTLSEDLNFFMSKADKVRKII